MCDLRDQQQNLAIQISDHVKTSRWYCAGSQHWHLPTAQSSSRVLSNWSEYHAITADALDTIAAGSSGPRKHLSPWSPLARWWSWAECLYRRQFFFWFVNYQVYAKSTEPIFHKIRWKGGTWATGKTIDFGVNPDHVTLGLGLYGVLPNSAWEDTLPGICLIVGGVA